MRGDPPILIDGVPMFTHMKAWLGRRAHVYISTTDDPGGVLSLGEIAVLEGLTGLLREQAEREERRKAIDYGKLAEAFCEYAYGPHLAKHLAKRPDK